jgi:HK97 family phage prohead protease
MMNKIFNLTSTFKALENDDGSVMIRGMASTADFDRAGDSISAEAWQKGGLKNFEKNPIILFNHDYDRPIGRATGMKAGPNGLELECKISKNAPGNVAELVKDGVLGAFSVGFRVKDADYIKETDGLMIKDAELFEVSVVSVPCNQAATFSLAKSFDSDAEYEAFKKTFTNRVDLAGQSLAKDEVNTSSVASDNTPKSAEITATKEIKMDQLSTIDLEAFAKKVADETAAKIAMKQAEQKAAADAEAKAQAEAQVQKAAQEEVVKSSIRSGIETGTERLMGDFEKALQAKDAKLEEVLAKYAKDMEEQKAEIAAMQNSKKSFSDRSNGGDLSKWGKDFVNAHLFGVVTGKGYNTDYAQSIFEKAGVTYTATSAAGVDVAVASTIEQEVRLALRTANLFREINVNSTATVLPIQPDSIVAAFGSGSNFSANLAERGGTPGTYATSQVLLKAHRMISSTFLENDIDESVLISILPMLTDAVARAHARAVDAMVINGDSGTGIVGLTGYAPTATDIAAAAADKLTADDLVGARRLMGKYGINPMDVAYVVSVEAYNDLLQDAGFSDITEVGSDMATKLTGMVGSVYGSPVVVTDTLSGTADGNTAAIAVNTRNYVIPRLRGVSVEQDYEVGNQRRVIVASQSLGFNELVAGAAGAEGVIKLAYTV